MKVLVALPAVASIYAQPSTFELASIKPLKLGAPDANMGCRGGPGTSTPGRSTCHAVTLPLLISSAYDLKVYQSRGQMVYSSGVSSENQFDIVANVADGTTDEQFREMQRQLLKDRFNLVMHFDTKEIDGYELVVAKGGPKLQPAGMAHQPGTARA